MDQLNGYQAQVRKEGRHEPIQQDMAQAVENGSERFFERPRGSMQQHSAQYTGVNSGVGSDGHLTQGYQQQNSAILTPTQPSLGFFGASTGMGFQGGSGQSFSNIPNMDPTQSPWFSGFPPHFFTPNPGTPSNANTGVFKSTHPFWLPAGAAQTGQYADQRVFLDNRFALPAQQMGTSGTPVPAQQASNVPRMPVAKANKPSAPDGHRLPITAPSQKSGGIPEPTDAYLMRASFLPKRRNQPGPLLVVIDLNGTLLHRPSRKNSTSFQSRRHTQEFVTYCVRTFWVVFWSSAKPENVKGMVDQLLTKPLRKQVVGVWGRDKFGLTEQDYNKRTQCYKRLTRLWNDPQIKSSYPSQWPGFEGGCWDQGNTVLIDDSVEKARSEPHNAITLPEYCGGIDDKGDVLPNVHDYLNELCHQEDVSAYMRAHPFKMS